MVAPQGRQRWVVRVSAVAGLAAPVLIAWPTLAVGRMGECVLSSVPSGTLGIGPNRTVEETSGVCELIF